MLANPGQVQMESIDDEVAARIASLQVVNPPDIRPSVLEELDLADRYFALQTVAGEVHIAYNRRGVSYVQRVVDVDDFETHFRQQFRRPAFLTAQPQPSLIRKIEATLEGNTRVQPPFDLSSVTDFNRAVLLKALQIPYGQVRPYTWIAQEIGHPKAQRAVGTALARNPIPLLIPCHRVVRNDGIIGNYGMGGPSVKRRILEAEGADPQSIESLSRAGFRLVGSDTTHIFCFPTCTHARRVADNHKVRFESVGQALRLGFRACKVCRPAVL